MQEVQDALDSIQEAQRRLGPPARNEPTEVSKRKHALSLAIRHLSPMKNWEPDSVDIEAGWYVR